MEKFVVLNKVVGETPLQTVEKYRSLNSELDGVSMAYAGRLDPMASGKLLVLLGDECKEQEKYHKLDKGYRFRVLFGTGSDTGDILGLLNWKPAPSIDDQTLKTIAKSLTGNISLQYPIFSSKTVGGKPLHLWALENKLHEIEIPIAHTKVHKLSLIDLESQPAEAIYREARERIESIEPVTEKSKALGADFRRSDVRMSWDTWLEYHKKQELQIATFDCVSSSGTYMRALAAEIGRQLGTPALAYSIERTHIGRFQPVPIIDGFWIKQY